MKALDDRTQNLQRESIAADLAARLAAIFKQYPPLCGFTVRERSSIAEDRVMVDLERGLCLADVSVFTMPTFCVTQEFCNRIAGLLQDLIDEEPAVIDLLCGRAFARTFH
jgi:hypothetical protein